METPSDLSICHPCFCTWTLHTQQLYQQPYCGLQSMFLCWLLQKLRARSKQLGTLASTTANFLGFDRNWIKYKYQVGKNCHLDNIESILTVFLPETLRGLKQTLCTPGPSDPTETRQNCVWVSPVEVQVSSCLHRGMGSGYSRTGYGISPLGGGHPWSPKDLAHFLPVTGLSNLWRGAHDELLEELKTHPNNIDWSETSTYLIQLPQSNL